MLLSGGFEGSARAVRVWLGNGMINWGLFSEEDNAVVN